MAVIQGVLFHYLFSILILQVVHGIYLRSGNQFRRGSQTRPQISSAAIIGKCFILCIQRVGFYSLLSKYTI